MNQHNLGIGGAAPASGGGGGGASAAIDVTFTSSGGVGSTNVQAAIVELDSEKAATAHAHVLADITDAGSAAALSSSAILKTANNLSDVANAGTTRSNLGLGTAAVVNTGTGAGNAILGNDARLTDARAASSINLAAATITNTLPAANIGDTTVAESKLNLTDLTTGNASASAHGFLPKLANDAAYTLLGDGTWNIGQRYRKVIAFCEDFPDQGTGLLTGTTTGSGAAFSWTNSVAGRMGIITSATGTATTGVARLGYQTSGVPGTIIFGAGTCLFEADITIPTVSDGTDTYGFKAGFNDNVGGADATDGAYFRYTHSVNSGKFECITRSNSSETATDSGITMTAGTWYRLTIAVNAAGTSVVFSINNVVVATVSTTIPTGAARATSLGLTILKSAGSTSRTYDCDLVAVVINLTTER